MIDHQAWKLVDTFAYLLPQRRNRVWGIAAVTGSEEVACMNETYKECLNDMATSLKLPDSEIFVEAPAVPIQEGRHAELLASAEKVHGASDLFLNASTSRSRLIAMSGGVPCITPNHPFYSTRLQRYLLPEELLRAQGIFPHCFKPTVWKQMAETKLGQNLAGNSFSSTVCQAAVLSSMAALPNLWSEMGTSSQKQLAPIPSILQAHLTSEPSSGASQLAPIPSSSQAHLTSKPSSGTLRRVTGKRTAPEYDEFVAKKMKQETETGNVKKQAKRRKYRRKTPGVDSRLFSKGKKDMVSIAKKMTVLLETNMLVGVEQSRNYIILYIYIYMCIVYWGGSLLAIAEPCRGKPQI